MGLEMLRRNKLRALLTMLGVIIGVMSVTLIVMISGGFQTFIKGEFDKIGSRTIFLGFEPGRRQEGEGVGGIEGVILEDAEMIRARVPSVDLVVPQMELGRMRAGAGAKKIEDAKPIASTADYFALNAMELTSGRLLNEEDSSQRRNVAVIGDEVERRLFGSNAVGKLIDLPGLTVEVVGVTKARSLMGGNSSAKDVVIPLETVKAKWRGGKTVDVLFLRAREGSDLNAAMDDVWRVMMEKSGNRPIYVIDSSESLAKVFGGILGGAGAILAAIAALSLLVGGIGIMNIMLVSVTERTREIGLRKALGAKRGAVLTQFLVEAATLSLVGGLIGMAIAYLLGLLVTVGTSAAKFPNEAGLQTPFPVTAAILSALFSAGIGVLFGLYPALSASKLDPIVALRRE